MAKKKLILIAGVALLITLLISIFNHHFFLTLPFALLMTWGFSTGFTKAE
ncbi:hypothetical protein [Enterococcus timonensis]|nr:hypothetical protein [Enterococcus timonensis]